MRKYAKLIDRKYSARADGNFPSILFALLTQTGNYETAQSAWQDRKGDGHGVRTRGRLRKYQIKRYGIRENAFARNREYKRKGRLGLRKREALGRH